MVSPLVCVLELDEDEALEFGLDEKDDADAPPFDDDGTAAAGTLDKLGSSIPPSLSVLAVEPALNLEFEFNVEYDVFDDADLVDVEVVVVVVAVAA
jgi:hypothetical protein